MASGDIGTASDSSNLGSTVGSFVGGAIGSVTGPVGAVTGAKLGASVGGSCCTYRVLNKSIIPKAINDILLDKQVPHTSD
jgi:hypothetical protein